MTPVTVLNIYMIKTFWLHVSSAEGRARLLVAGRVSSSSGVRSVELEQMRLL